MDAFCHIPYDAAHPDPATHAPIVDWGKVTKVADEHGALGDRPVTLRVIEVAGQRDRYRFDDEIGALGRLETHVGDMLALCEEDHGSDSNIYKLAAGGLGRVLSVVPITKPPRIVELANLAPLHIDDVVLLRDGGDGKITLDPDRRYLVHAKVTAADGDRWAMDKWWLEVPSGIRGGNLVAAGKRLWIVVEQPKLEDQPAGKPHLVLRAAAVIDDLFP